MTKKTNAKSPKKVSKEERDFPILPTEIATLVDEITSAENTSQEFVLKVEVNFLKLGDELVKTKTEMDLSKKELVALKTKVSEKLGSNDLRNITKVFKVASDDRIKALREEDRVPPNWGWGTLYLLTGLKNDEFEKVTADVSKEANETRDELFKRIKSLRVSDDAQVSSKKKLVIKSVDGGGISSELENEIASFIEEKGLKIS